MADHIIIIGGGWSGLATALHLSDSTHNITLLEAAPILGGRARGLAQNPEQDNGQHLLIGAYQHFLDILKKLNIKETTCLQRLSLAFHFQVNEKKFIHLQTSKFLPSPLHLLVALFTLNISWKNRLKTMLKIDKLMKHRFTHDISVAELLGIYQQPKDLIEVLWEPLCIAALNTPIQEASAKIFVNILNIAFKSKNASDLLLPCCSLHELFPQKAQIYLQQRNINIFLEHRVTKIVVEENTLKGVMVREKFLPADKVVIATSVAHIIDLIAPISILEPITEQIKKITTQPIYTAYFQYDENITLSYPMIGLLKGYGQWLFDLKYIGKPGLISMVISAKGEHEAHATSVLLDILQQQISVLYPKWPRPKKTWLLKEKRATMHCGIDIDKQKPVMKTSLSGVYITGDYMIPGLPSTLESAIQSGILVAEEIKKTLCS